MCGIVGAVAKRPVQNILIDGLKKLEYRGYDSAGMAIIEDNSLKRIRVVGKVRELESALQLEPTHGATGIAHTRWATHGIPSEQNAHPFISNDEFALVHNGIIENHSSFRAELLKAGYHFKSQTDTEVIVHLIHHYFRRYQDLIIAVRHVVGLLKGAYALGIVAKAHPARLIAVRQGCPLVIGRGKGENFIASDPLALLNITHQYIYLEDYDLADISLNHIHIYNKDHQSIHRETHFLNISEDHGERGEYRHFMEKEIYEQPDAIAACLEGRIVNHKVMPAIFGPHAESIFPELEQIQLIACGTSYHATLVARYWIESLTDIQTQIDIGSEFRYREIAKPKQSLLVSLSQSGETADTLAAFRRAKNMGYMSSLSICNVAGSSLVRESDHHFLTRAGLEIGVASTKAFVTQLVSLLLLALSLVKDKSSASYQQMIEALQTLPSILNQVLETNEWVREWAHALTEKQHAIFLARGSLYPIALEGALKLKEISYIHAEGYPSGELKHGPLALVDSMMPVITAVPQGKLYEKNLSNLQEVQARGGKLFILTDAADLDQDCFSNASIIPMPTVHPILAPIVYTIPLQLLAYHVAVLKGTDVDQPRNLAKSVTVE